jgi:hypothetical protein
MAVLLEKIEVRRIVDLLNPGASIEVSPSV